MVSLVGVFWLNPASASPVCQLVFSSPTKQEQLVTLATRAGLRYLEDAIPGFQRIKTANGLLIVNSSGFPVTDPAVLARIEALKIPPGYSDVWISPDPTTHLQATGVDTRGRKQYRYHPSWSEVAGEVKFNRITRFGTALPKIRTRVGNDISSRGTGKDKVLATVVRLLERSMIRVGNDEYAETNESYGLTTLLKSHVTVTGDQIVFAFNGKSSVAWERTVVDREVAKVLNALLRLPGERLFQWTDSSGQHQTVKSADVNAYIKTAAGGLFSAKDFRTWGGTVEAVRFQIHAPRPKTETDAKLVTDAAVESVASVLGNTPSVSRTSYIHPEVLRLDLVGGELQRIASSLPTSDRPLEEAVTLDILNTSIEQR